MIKLWEKYKDSNDIRQLLDNLNKNLPFICHNLNKEIRFLCHCISTLINGQSMSYFEPDLEKIYGFKSKEFMFTCCNNSYQYKRVGPNDQCKWQIKDHSCSHINCNIHYSAQCTICRESDNISTHSYYSKCKRKTFLRNNSLIVCNSLNQMKNFQDNLIQRRLNIDIDKKSSTILSVKQIESIKNILKGTCNKHKIKIDEIKNIKIQELRNLIDYTFHLNQNILYVTNFPTVLVDIIVDF